MEFPEWIDKAIDMYNDELPYYKIARKLGVDRHNVAYYLKKKGCYPKGKNSHFIRNNVSRKYKLDESVFKKIETEEAAYWLGFLYADGCVNKVSNCIEITLQDKDIESLEKFNKFLCSSKQIEKKNKGNYELSRVSVYSLKMKNDLIELGCIPEKSKKLTFPNYNQVPRRLMCHFIRGYFDGDGHVSRHVQSNGKISYGAEILGTKEFLEGLCSEINIQTKLHSFKHSPTTYRICLNGKNKDIFYDFIYSNSNIDIKRKHDKFIELAPY